VVLGSLWFVSSIHRVRGPCYQRESFHACTSVVRRCFSRSSCDRLATCVCFCLQVTSSPVEVNVTSLVGDTVTLACDTSVNVTDVDWIHQDTPTSLADYVYSNRVVYDIFRPRFTVDRRPHQGKYDMVISEVQWNDSGLTRMHICIDDFGLGARLFVYNLTVVTGMLQLQPGLQLGIYVTLYCWIVFFSARINISLKELCRKSDVEMFEILHRDWNVKPILAQIISVCRHELGVAWSPTRQFQHWYYCLCKAKAHRVCICH